MKLWGQYISAFLLITFTSTLAEMTCKTHPNHFTKKYTYTVCTGTDVFNLNTSKIFCNETVKDSHVVTFPTQEEYDFLRKTLNETVDTQTFKYVPGIFQKKNIVDRYNPMSGEFYWVTDPENKITNQSATYWKPFERYIIEYESLHSFDKETGTFVLDSDGTVYSGVSVAGGESETKVEGGVVCVQNGVQKKVLSPPTLLITPPAKQLAEFDYWIVIAVVAGVIAFGVILAAIIYCAIKNTKRKKDFQKVPQSDNNGQTPQQFTA